MNGWNLLGTARASLPVTFTHAPKHLAEPTQAFQPGGTDKTQISWFNSCDYGISSADEVLDHQIASTSSVHRSLTSDEPLIDRSSMRRFEAPGDACETPTNPTMTGTRVHETISR